MPEIIEISGIDYSQGLPVPDEMGHLGQTDESYAAIVVGAFLFSTVLGGIIGAVVGFIFNQRFTWESAARGAAVSGTITAIRVIRENSNEKGRSTATAVNLVV
jgi:hypothetical protein